ncbi:hypothetical protein C0J52_24466 [Blattella germanica]|nr:hypothetical protein C0J52_24466 [Blattella germanica]
MYISQISTFFLSSVAKGRRKIASKGVVTGNEKETEDVIKDLSCISDISNSEVMNTLKSVIDDFKVAIKSPVESLKSSDKFDSFHEEIIKKKNDLQLIQSDAKKHKE